VPSSLKKRVATTTGYYTRYATIVVALSDTDAQTVAQAFVECFVFIYGIPTSIKTAGKNILSDV